jgi:hypothetical protein
VTSKTNIQHDIDLLELTDLKIEKYFNDCLPLHDLIYDLESYLNQITVIDKEWRKNFRTIWLDIEVAYSLGLDSDSCRLTSDGNKLIFSSLKTLKKMTINKIKDLKCILSEE